jgi:spermidine synthase
MKLDLPGDWYIERLTGHEIHGHRIKRRLAKVRTKFQTAEVLDTRDYGRCLFLDGLVQSTRMDEFIYHESLVHPGLMLHPRPETVFLAGGGEGAPLREILKHPSVKKIIMVEIDRGVVELSRKHLRPWHAGAWRDPRLRLFFEDARVHLENNPVRYDVLILDLCDPGESGPARKLFTVEFYRLLRKRMNPQGLAVIQAGSSNLNMPKGFSRIYQSLRDVFGQVLPYQVCVPAYVGPWVFFLARRTRSLDFQDRKVLIRRYRSRRLAGRLSFYDPDMHQALFTLPPYFRGFLRSGRKISDRSPLRLQRK